MRRVTQSDISAEELKQLIPNPNMRRRMSPMVRMAVATAVKVLGNEQPTHILCVSKMAQLTETMQFMQQVIDSGATAVSPTPFITSTFNTVGGYIALVTGCHCENITLADSGEDEAERYLHAVFAEQPEAKVLVCRYEEPGRWNDDFRAAIDFEGEQDETGVMAVSELREKV